MTPSELIRTYRPCGACGAHVPMAIGCKHWRPAGRLSDKAAQATRDRKAKWRANLTPEQQVQVRERNRLASQRQRDRRKAEIAALGKDYR